MIVQLAHFPLGILSVYLRERFKNIFIPKIFRLATIYNRKRFVVIVHIVKVTRTLLALRKH